MQQSTISRRVRDLEDRMGASLFERYNGGIRLTYAGERLLPRARNILEYVQESLRNVCMTGKIGDEATRWISSTHARK